ncbi:MAG: YqeG family HAD IIIA-type phosphatase [Candidatus Eremiobacteraeota bacterium]|nr:YqeG family HAD IIIA-type phosphatase [Candidatus Eremiobacteraeota bacterium]
MLKAWLRDRLAVFLPDLRLASVQALSADLLAERRLSFLLLDFDNTLAEWRADELAPPLLDWCARMRAAGFALCLVSNASRRRLQPHADRLGIECFSRAGKPSRRALRKAMTRLGGQPDNTAIVGDQLFTDVWAGNRLGITTVLVTRISTREQFWMIPIRWMEIRLLRWLETPC